MKGRGRAALVAIGACAAFALVWSATPAGTQLSVAQVAVENAPQVKAYTQSRVVHLLRAGQTIRGTMVLGPLDTCGYREIRVNLPDISAAVDVAFESPDKKYAVVGTAAVPWGRAQGEGLTMGNYLIIPVLGNKCWVTIRVSTLATLRLTAPQGIWAYLVN